eukprot:scaffold7643_cov267-Pinguiococcus_pyrenoidosus.AAC.1
MSRLSILVKTLRCTEALEAGDHFWRSLPDQAHRVVHTLRHQGDLLDPALFAAEVPGVRGPVGALQPPGFRRCLEAAAVEDDGNTLGHQAVEEAFSGRRVSRGLQREGRGEVQGYRGLRKVQRRLLGTSSILDRLKVAQRLGVAGVDDLAADAVVVELLARDEHGPRGLRRRRQYLQPRLQVSLRARVGVLGRALDGDEGHAGPERILQSEAVVQEVSEPLSFVLKGGFRQHDKVGLALLPGRLAAQEGFDALHVRDAFARHQLSLAAKLLQLRHGQRDVEEVGVGQRRRAAEHVDEADGQQIQRELRGVVQLHALQFEARPHTQKLQAAAAVPHGRAGKAKC